MIISEAHTLQTKYETKYETKTTCVTKKKCKGKHCY